MPIDLDYGLELLAVSGLWLWLLARRPTAARGVVVASGFLLCAAASNAAFPGSVFVHLRRASWFVFVGWPLFSAAAAGILWRSARRTAVLFAALAGAFLLVAVQAFLIEPRWLDVSRHQLESARITQPIRVAIVSDLQTDRVGKWEEQVLRRALDERPDLILLTGDYVQVDDAGLRRAQLAALRELLLRLDFGAPLGVYAVGGNSDARDWPEGFRGTKVRVFEKTTRFPAGEIELVAVSERFSFRRGLPIAPSDSDRFTIAFGHSPDFALSPRAHVDLVVAGHTHGGQVQIPFFGPPITFSKVPRAWAAGGLHEIVPERRWLVVSRGLGLERQDGAPELRFNCRPELVVIDLVPVKSR